MRHLQSLKTAQSAEFNNKPSAPRAYFCETLTLGGVRSSCGRAVDGGIDQGCAEHDHSYRHAEKKPDGYAQSHNCSGNACQQQEISEFAADARSFRRGRIYGFFKPCLFGLLLIYQEFDERGIIGNLDFFLNNLDIDTVGSVRALRLWVVL